MPKSSSSGASQPHQAFQKLTQLLKRPVDDAAAAAELEMGVMELTKTEQVNKLVLRPRTSKEAAALSSWVAAALQCAGWLVAAHSRKTGLVRDIWAVLLRCVTSSSTILKNFSEISPDLLRELLQPRAGSHSPGLTRWVPMVAKALAGSYSVMPATGAAEGFATRHIRSAIAEALVDVWIKCFSAWAKLTTNSSSSSSGGGVGWVGPAAWMHPSLLRLADILLQQPVRYVTHNMVLHTLLAGPSTGVLTPLGQPQLAAAAGVRADDAKVVEALWQGCWWRALATCVTALAGPIQAATEPAAAALHGPQHPGKFCPAYHLEQAYASQPFHGMGYPSRAASASLVLHVLLVGQLWDVLPWQLQQLQEAPALSHESAALEAPDSTMAAGAASSSSAAGGAGNGGSGCSSVSRSNHTTSSSSSSQVLSSQQVASLLQSSVLPDALKGWRVVLEVSGLYWPLLPDRYSGSTQQEEEGGVTLQQLQLAVSALARAALEAAVSAGLLLALLLQRADPGLRASFLTGPGGTVLLAAAQYWGQYAFVEPDIGSQMQIFTMYQPAMGSHDLLAPALLSAQGGSSSGSGPVQWTPVGPLYTLALLLAWCYLQPVKGWEAALSQLGPPPQKLSLLMTLHNFMLSLAPNMRRPECLALRSTPCEVLQFAPGCAPTPLLLGTLEMLLRNSNCVFDSPLLRCVVAFVHATAVWLGDTAGGCAPEAGTADSQQGDSSSSSSGSTTATTSSSSSSTANSSSSSSTANSSKEVSGDVASGSRGAADAGEGQSSVASPSTSPDAGDPSTGTSTSSSSSSSNSGQTSMHEHNNMGSSTSSSSTPTADNALLLGSLASMAVTLAALLHKDGAAVDEQQQQQQQQQQEQQEERVQTLGTLALGLVPPCCLVAAKLLHLAAQQLEVQGPHALPALQLAAAAQQLAAACGEVAERVVAGLMQGGDQAGVINLDHATYMLCMEAPLHLLQAELVALRGAQPWWQQQAHSQDMAAVEVGEPEASSSGSSNREAAMPAASSSTTDSSNSTNTMVLVLANTSSSISSSAQQRVFRDCADQLAGTARSIQRKCPTRLQLVGCSHPRCTNLSGPSAEGLVAGRKGVRCGGCRVARYCSAACQQADWPQHRRVCRQLAAAAVAAGKRPVPL